MRPRMSWKWRTLALTLIGAIGSAVAAPFAYVPNEKSGAIAVIDTIEAGDLT